MGILSTQERPFWTAQMYSQRVKKTGGEADGTRDAPEIAGGSRAEPKTLFRLHSLILVSLCRRSLDVC